MRWRFTTGHQGGVANRFVNALTAEVAAEYLRLLAVRLSRRRPATPAVRSPSRESCCPGRKRGRADFWPASPRNIIASPQVKAAAQLLPLGDEMKAPLVLAALLSSALVASGPAHARGCLKGALVGGLAGHYMGHHGFLGAAAGCLIGRHEAQKSAQHRYPDRHLDGERS